MKKFRIALWVAVGIVFVGLLALLTFEARVENTSLAESPYGVPFELVDQRGAPVTEAAFREKPTALFFGFTHCPEVCPTTLYELNGWMQQVDPQGDRLNAFMVTVDPERDTPDVLDLYISNVSPRVTGITGAPEKIEAMIRGFKVYARKVPLDAADPDGDYSMDHTALVFLLDDGGRFSGTIAYGENPEIAVKKLENLVKG